MEETPRILISRKDDTFDPSRTKDYNLVLCINENTFSYCIRDAENGKFIVLESYQEKPDRIPEILPWTRQSFRSVHVIIESNRSTLVPVLLYDDQSRGNLLDFTVERGNREQIMSDHLQLPELFNLYPVPEELTRMINKNFPGCTMSHIASVMIGAIWLNFKNRIHERKLFLNLRDGSFDLVVFDGALLHYSNAFSYKSPEDIAYYVIFVMEQLDLNPEETGAVLLGNIEKKSQLYELLFRYIRNLEFPARNESVRLAPVFHDIPDQQYYLLLNPALCG